MARVLGDEGFRIFFPLAALYAGFWPLIWVGVWHFDLPFARTIPATVWHGYEMVFGAWGAALLGFLTTAVPEWTNSERLRHRPLWGLAALWACARVVGLTGADALQPLAALADLAWLAALTGYLLMRSLQLRTTRVLAFAGWVAALTASAAATHHAMWVGNVAMMISGVRFAGLLFLGLLGLALARIAAPVSNVILDPSERTSPFRPHPARLNLAPGLVAVALIGELLAETVGARFGFSPAVGGYLWIAAGAAFMDRVAEHFIGRAFFRTEILMLAGSAALAGCGLLLLGAARLGAPWPPSAALHAALMGGLGLGVLAVLSIAGRLHAGQTLGMHAATKAALALLVASVLLRVLPPMGVIPWPPGGPHLLASLAWCAAFLLWLRDYGPLVIDPRTVDRHEC